MRFLREEPFQYLPAFRLAVLLALWLKEMACANGDGRQNAPMDINFMSEWSCDVCLLSFGGQGGRRLGTTSALHQLHMEERRHGQPTHPISLFVSGGACARGHAKEHAEKFNRLLGKLQQRSSR